MPPHKQPYMNTYRRQQPRGNVYKNWDDAFKKEVERIEMKRELLRVRVYAKIEQLRQRIYNWETNNGQWEEDLKFVDKHQENMDNDETYYPHTNSLIEMNNLWLEYYDRLNPNNFEYNKFSDIIDE